MKNFFLVIMVLSFLVNFSLGKTMNDQAKYDAEITKSTCKTINDGAVTNAKLAELSYELLGNTDVIETANYEETNIFFDVYFSENKLEITHVSGRKYVECGTVIQEDKGLSKETVIRQLQDNIENDNFCGMHGDDIHLHFEDEIPKSIKVYNHIYLDEDLQRFLYSSLQECYIIDNVNSTETIHIGMDFAAALTNDFTARHYRVVRLVCTYESQIVEYYMFIN